MIQRQISSGLKPLLLGLLLLVAGGVMTVSAPAFANDFHHRRENAFRERSYSPPPYAYHHDEGRHEGFYRQHHHNRCREQLVPYWDSYWGVWSQRVERVCW